MVPAALTLALSGAALGMSPALADSAPQDPQNPATPLSVTADALPTAQINGVVWAQAIAGNRVYVGGKFTNARPAGAAAGQNTVVRNNMMAYNLTTGVLDTSFAPSFNAQVLAVALSPDKTRLYVGGDFTTVNGTARKRIAAFNTATGALVSTFAPPVNSSVSAIVATNSTVYVGGDFLGVGSQDRGTLAAFNASNGALLAWAPQATGGYVYAMTMNPAGTKVAIGGSFTAVNGSANPGYGMAMLDTATGASLPFAANTIVRNGTVNGAITALTSDANSVYGGGYTYGRSGGTLEGTFAASWDGGAVEWINDCHGDTYSIAKHGDGIYMASHTHYCENVEGFHQGPGGVGDYPYHRAYATTAVPVGTVSWEPDQGRYYSFAGNRAPAQLTWFPDFNTGTFTGQIQGPWSVATSDDYMVYGGEFTRVNGQAQQGLVRFADPDIAPNDEGPSLFNASYPLNVTSTEAGKVRINWGTNEDIDNEYLTYRVYRDTQNVAGLVHTRQAGARYWNPYTMGFSDSGLAPGSTHQYRVVATDPFGNVANSSWTNVTVASSGTDSAYVKAVYDSQPTDYWRMGEASGTVLGDRTGFRPATASTGVTRGTAGAISNDSDTASTFNGTTTGYAATAVQDNPSDVFTLESWFKTSVSTGGRIVGRSNRNTGSSSKTDRQIYMDNTGHIRFGVKPNQTRQVVASNGTYADGAWHHAAASLSPEGMKLYVDGELVGSRTDVTVGEHLALGYWRIGGDRLSSWPSATTEAYFNGSIDEVAVYKRALSASEIAGHYAAGAGVPTPNVAPAASFTSTTAGLTVQVSSTSTDSDGSITGYAWDFGDGGTASTADASHAYALAGTYSVKLTVTDDDGATGTVTKEVTVAEPPANSPPTASFTSSVADLTVGVSSTSTDSDGSITGYAWDFGDGGTASTQNASHAYALAGTYDVKLTVTDDDGATGTVTKQVIVSTPVEFALDGFERTVADGWGSADKGGAWTRSGTATNFSVSGGLGRIRMSSAGSGPGMALNGVASSDTEVRVRLGSDKAATGGGVYASVQPRYLANGDNYYSDVRFVAGGSVTVSLGRQVGGVETALQTRTVAGLTVAAGGMVQVKTQAVGTSPTTVRAKVWKVGDPEPSAWTATVSDTTTALQSTGGIALWTYLSSSATNAPVTALFDELWAGPTA